MTTIAEALRELDGEGAEGGQPDEFFYRVDALMGVRTMRQDTLLRPRRWDSNDRHPHVDLLAADAHRGLDEAIFRLSFWRTLKDGLHDWRTRAWQHSMVLMRIRRRAVHQALQDWTFAEDDHLDGKAELIWKLGSADEDQNDFHVGGVPLEQVEVFDASSAQWEPWHASHATVVDAERLAASGWSPVEITTCVFRRC